MRRLAFVAALLLALAVGFVAVIMLASEMGGEVVELQTLAADGSQSTTRLWVVDFDGASWLRSGVPTSSWLVRIEGDDRVSVVREGSSRSMRAVPVRDAETRDQIHARMREKYGCADRLVSIMRDGSKSIPVRLEPR